MSDSANQTPSSVTTSDVYQVLTSLVIHSEQIRWGRLNIFLVTSSILVASWVGVLTVDSHNFHYKKLLLIVLCIPGIVLGGLMTRLSWRSSEYLDDFHDKALEMENHFKNLIPKPFHLSENRRETVRKDTEKYTSSKWLVSAIPFTFAVLFNFLAVFTILSF